jgi:hypothetical protein
MCYMATTSVPKVTSLRLAAVNVNVMLPLAPGLSLLPRIMLTHDLHESRDERNRRGHHNFRTLATNEPSKQTARRRM